MYSDKITTITQGCDFTLRIRAKRVATRGYVNVSFVEVSSIHVNLVSLPATKTALAHTIDEEGRLLLDIPGQTLDCNSYGIEILGFYNNGNWRQQIAPAFHIVRTSTEDNYALTESDERTIDLTIIMGETYLTTKGFNQAMDEHDADSNAHQDIRNQMATMETARQTDLQDLQTQLTTMETARQTDLQNLQTQLTTMETERQTDLQDIQAQLTTMETARQTDRQELQTQLTTMETIVEGNVDDIAQLQSDLQIAGKVDDVKVNGTSVLDGKVASITVPTKVSDLTNDADYQTATEVEQAIANATPTKVSDLTNDADYAPKTYVNEKVADAGKVDDVKVNGVSVLTGKEAEITMPTKVSDLTNDAHYQTANEVQQAIEVNLVPNAQVTVDNNVGTPAATVTKDGNTLQFAFQNMKGETGATGATGPQGQKGDPGDSVLVGEGDLPLAHVLGQDNTKAISQKGVSDVLYPLVGDYYYEVEIAATQEGKYLAGTSVIATASSTPTLNIAFYEIPEDADSATISIPKTGSSSCKVYAYANSTSATKVSSPTESGNSGAKNLTIQPSHQYKYLLVSYNSTSGEPTVQFHKPAKDWADVMNASEIYRTFSKTYTKDECNVSGEYIASNGTLKTGYSAFKRSEFLSTMRATKITITCGYTSTDATIVAFYSSEQNFLSGILANNQSAQEYDVPVLARYIRISNKSNSTISIVLDAVEINGFNATIDELTSDIEQVKATMPSRFINILHVGNSFTMNTHTNLGTLLSHLGVTNINIQHTNVGGASLGTFVGKLNNAETIAVETTRGNAVATSGSLQSILSHDWDVIVFQQVSASAGNYASYNPHLAILINAARKYCTRKDVKIGFETVWETYMTTFASVVEATRSMMADYRLDFLIPAGTAVENARLTSMNADVNDFSSDTKIQHLAVGVGRYVAACAFYCEVLEPMTGIPVYNDITTTINSDNGLGSVAVTDDNRELCQKCAEYAVIHPYGTLNVENL